jgi:hypothetical protein
MLTRCPVCVYVRALQCPHDYSWSQGTYTDYNSFHTYLGDQVRHVCGRLCCTPSHSLGWASTG